ncbi:hypothetical protein AB0H00_22350 [Nocardia sp. NPDC023852]|uniref:hypothetical protein n=1 Tax=Nocardia sp. NPDC023852 TaxID=3154697 RepID=UPI0033D26247
MRANSDWVPMAPATMPLPADPGLVLNFYTVEPATPSADAMTLLGTWAATNIHSPAPADQSTITGE